MSKHSFKELERQRREDEILEEAERLLVERGYASLNMDELANTVGISKPTLYQHFRAKEELVMQILRRSYRQVDEYLSRPLTEPAIERLTAFIHHSLTLHAPISIIASLRGDARPETIWTALHNDPQMENYKQNLRGQLYMLVKQAKAEGDIDPNIPDTIVIHSLFAMNRSLSNPELQTEIANSPEKLEQAINCVIRVFLHGVTPEKQSI